MELKKAKQIVDDMLDLCMKLGDDNLSNACEGIYNDIEAAKEVEEIIASGRELMVFVGEAPWADFDLEDIRDEIEMMYDKMMTEYEDF